MAANILRLWTGYRECVGIRGSERRSRETKKDEREEGVPATAVVRPCTVCEQENRHSNTRALGLKEPALSIALHLCRLTCALPRGGFIFR
jgi:hypothetical protein